MSIVITPQIQPVVAPGATVAPIVLQAGSVISARVQQVLTGDMVRIAIAGQSIDVLSQVPLQAGQTLQLAVSQGNDGTVRLAVVTPQDAALASQAQAANASATPDTVTLRPARWLASSPRRPLPRRKSSSRRRRRSPVSLATQTAATQQAGLAPLFANLTVACGLDSLPPQLQQAVAQVLAQRTGLDQNLTGSDIKQAFQGSGLFLEASLAAGSLTSSAAMPYLKAALLVLRQVLVTALDGAEPPAATVMPATASPATIVRQAAGGRARATDSHAHGGNPAACVASTVVPQGTRAGTRPGGPGRRPGLRDGRLAAGQQHAGAGDTAGDIAGLAPDIAALAATFQGGAVRPNAAGTLDPALLSQIVLAPSTPADAAARRRRLQRRLNLLQEAVQASPLLAVNPSGSCSRTASCLRWCRRWPAGPGVSRRRCRDGAHQRARHRRSAARCPAAQPVLPPRWCRIRRRNRRCTVCSPIPTPRSRARPCCRWPLCPDRPMRRRGGSIRWPSAGISKSRSRPPGHGDGAVRDFRAMGGGGNEVAAAKQVWRARFSLDVEPAGPVHALVSLVGERTSVRMWAERPATAAQLRAGAAQLSQALSKAELTPGDIVIRDGAPPQPAPARAGHFLDRAL